MAPGTGVDGILYGDHSRSSAASDRKRLDRMGTGLSDTEIINLPSIRMVQDVAGEDHQRILSCAKFKALLELEHDEDAAVEAIETLLCDGEYSVDTGMIDQSLKYWIEDEAALKAQVQIYCEDQPELFEGLEAICS